MKQDTMTKRKVEMLTVADVAREHGVDPKVARAALRAAGMKKSKGGRWPAFRRGSPTHREVFAAITGEAHDAVVTAKP